MEKRTSDGLRKKLEYSSQWRKEHYKRISLNVTPERYNKIKDISSKSGESLNSYINKAIDMRIDSDI